MARLVRHAVTGLVIAVAAAFSPQTAHAQEYPWCLSREGYLYCFYTTQEQCQWTASGIGGCALNPRLLFPVKPRDLDKKLNTAAAELRTLRKKTWLSFVLR